MLHRKVSFKRMCFILDTVNFKVINKIKYEMIRNYCSNDYLVVYVTIGITKYEVIIKAVSWDELKQAMLILIEKICLLNDAFGIRRQ